MEEKGFPIDRPQKTQRVSIEKFYEQAKPLGTRWDGHWG